MIFAKNYTANYTATRCKRETPKEKTSQLIEIARFYVVGDTWIEHVTPAV